MLRAMVRKAATAGLGLGLLVGCGAGRFRPPNADTPHADLQVRVVYHQDFDQAPSQRVTIDGKRIETPSGLATSHGWARALRLVPGEHELAFHASFEHAELVTEFVRPQIPGCSPGMSTSVVLNDCVNLGARAQPTTDWRWMEDAECKSALALSVQSNEQVRMTFHFYGHASPEHPACAIECVSTRAGQAEPSACIRGATK